MQASLHRNRAAKTYHTQQPSLGPLENRPSAPDSGVIQGPSEYEWGFGMYIVEFIKYDNQGNCITKYSCFYISPEP